MRLPDLGPIEKENNRGINCWLSEDSHSIISITQTGWFYTGSLPEDEGGEIEDIQKLYYLGFTKLEE